MKKLSRKITSKFTMLFCAVILGYFILIKKDYDNPAIAFIGIFMLLEGVYYFWQFYKKNDTIKFDDKF
ncbi:Uncharacterised protein [Moraxella lacunata]|uniref:Uncharacterized protein n=2 Tax=Moraxella lacunata TaxID=477 RepID=A0A378QDZ2_MORLA|nr:hypothetical protein [Moraxella lacunata]STY98742.1 Uncharacterised protein [Moraxella lacunata]